MSYGTTRRTIRVDDEIWLPAKAKADKRGDNLSDVIRRALVLYTEDQQPNRNLEPDPTKPGTWTAPVTGFYRLPVPLAPEPSEPLTWQLVPGDGRQ